LSPDYKYMASYVFLIRLTNHDALPPFETVLIWFHFNVRTVLVDVKADVFTEISQHPGIRAFPVAAAKAWNLLPPVIRPEDNYLTFRRHLK